MTTVSILIGLPGSGKSTWSKKKAVAEPRTVIINRDSIRTMLKGAYVYDEDLEVLVKAITFSAVREALSLNFNLIIDETHTTKERRQCTYNLINLFGYEINIVYVHFTETKRNLEYRMRDARGIEKDKWRSVIKDMTTKFEHFKGEDFDKLIEVAMV